MLTPDVINNIVLAVIAIANAIGAYIAYRNSQAIKGVKRDIATVEKATNSMKDALVISTDKASRAEGHAAGLIEGRLGAEDRIASSETQENTQAMTENTDAVRDNTSQQTRRDNLK